MFEKCAKLFINAWNWKAYKVPNSLGKDHVEKYDELTYKERMSNGKFVIWSEGIYEFADNQSTDSGLYYKVQKDICARWKKRLEEKVPVVEKMLEGYPGIRVDVDCDEGDGDEGCVYPTYRIEIPVSSMK